MIKVFDIGGASRDEVEGIRNLLEESGIEYYETPHSNYGATTAAIWVYNKKDYKRARKIVDAIQVNLKVMNKFQQTDKSQELETKRKIRLLPFVIFVCIILLYMMMFGLTRP